MTSAIDALAARLRLGGCVFAEEEAALLLTVGDGEVLEDLVRRRLEGQPLEYLLGWVEFAGLRLEVADGVFVPRRRTEALVPLALDALPLDAIVVELCCGIGALAAAVHAARRDVRLWAGDIDPDAVAVARRNLPDGDVTVGDLYAVVPFRLRGRVDLIMVNAPYVPTAEIEMMPAEAREHEHRVALDGGSDGLDVQRRVLAGALDWLDVGGRLLMETSRPQADRVATLAVAHGLAAEIVEDDDLGATVLIATRVD